MALSGIAIAIGTMVDMGIVICENILKHLDEAKPGENSLEVVYRASKEVAGAVLTAVSTTVVGFLPVFTMTAAEGKLFKPLAYTKTFALIASVIVAIFLIPPFAHVLLAGKIRRRTWRFVAHGLVVLGGLVMAIAISWWIGLLVMGIGGYHIAKEWIPADAQKYVPWAATGIAAFTVLVLLADHWTPLGPEKGGFRNFIFVGIVIGGLLGLFRLFEHFYAPVLGWFLRFKLVFLAMPVLLVVAGVLIWGGLGKEFMPPLDEGSYLLMPTTMPHASIGEALDVLQKQDMSIRMIPEVETAVGKIGRAETPLDPAPISMIETVINYRPEYIVDRDGHRVSFRHDPDGTEEFWNVLVDGRGLPVSFPYDPDTTRLFKKRDAEPVPGHDWKPYNVHGRFVLDEDGGLIPDPDGKPFRLWRPALDPAINEGREPWPGIKKPDDIWKAIVKAAEVPGTTSAPRLQPIAARIVMLQSGMRAPMGVKIKGPDLDTIERMGYEIEKALKEVPSVEASAVIADRIVGKPYLEIDIDRKAIARYGIPLRKVQDVIEVAIGGRRITTSVEGRERYPVRVRYMRELRDNIETLDRILVPGAGGVQIPMEQLAEVQYVRGPQVIKSEDTFLIGYVLFDMKPGHAEVDVVEEAAAYLKNQEEIFNTAYADAVERAGRIGRELSEGDIATLPGIRRRKGVTYTFAGSYENQIRSEKTLMVVLPLALFVIFIILYFQFNSVVTTFLVFIGIIVAWAGGFIMIWLYAQPWFLDFSLFGVDMRELFQVHPLNLSVAVWVGFLALFGIASDDGVVMATYLGQSFAKRRPRTIKAIREATLAAGLRRIRPCLMTTATTIIALVPVLTSTGRGADVMVPMAIPVFGGMVFEVITLFVVPVLYCTVEEIKVRLGIGQAPDGEPDGAPESGPGENVPEAA
ncbi:MAG: efflux RND transporter permease subunit [Planctomycetota bacterium]